MCAADVSRAKFDCSSQGIDLLRPLKLWLNNRKLEAAINIELDRKIRKRTADMDAERVGKAAKQKRKSIIDLALTAYEMETAMASRHGHVEPIRDLQSMPSVLRKDLIDSIKTFFFAGHDTTVGADDSRSRFVLISV